MAVLELTTGLIENPAVAGLRSTSTLAVRITNDDTATVAIQINGFYLDGTTKVQYVTEFFTLNTGSVASRNYYAQFEGFEFQFSASSLAVQVSAWGKDSTGRLNAAHRIVAREFDPFS
ncbi:MAG: hypothetical protein QMC95_15400 [Desulfitobacteriaceae bacterium]|nr:hypothetical protein [Desulfitobacteriaceae bacterium]MDI6880228.1 hypothetical protein [Desulfitobacteriaceae bacterium]MDI6915578.1 hypothetical protein [Desulfitobacteriaceae bacterium]